MIVEAAFARANRRDDRKSSERSTCGKWFVMPRSRACPPYHIESTSKLQPRWFCGVEAVGIVVGAGNLEPMVNAVVARLKQFSAGQHMGMLDGMAH